MAYIFKDFFQAFFFFLLKFDTSLLSFRIKIIQGDRGAEITSKLNKII